MNKGWCASAIVNMAPQAMGSKRAFVGKSGKAHVVDSKPVKLRNFQSEVREQMLKAAPQTPRTGPISVGIVVVAQRPKDHFRSGKNAGVLKASADHWCTTKPDIDKVLRAILDCGTGIWWRDDSQVCKFHQLVKRYTQANERPFIAIDAKELVIPPPMERGGLFTKEGMDAISSNNL